MCLVTVGGRERGRQTDSYNIEIGRERERLRLGESEFSNC